MLKAEIEFWKNVILSGKKYEPVNKEQEASYDIASFFINNPQKNKKVAA